jgi:hypothetical protein
MEKAQVEFEILKKSYLSEEDKPIALEFEGEILALVDKFGNSGQSGGSALYTAAIIADIVKKLCMHEPLGPITGIDEEWIDIGKDMGGKVRFQNKRQSAIFKDGDNKPYYLNAIVFKGQNGSCFTGSSVKLKGGGSIGSRQYIKSFPFIPKTFYIDVIETEWSDKQETSQKVDGGWWISVIKDESQLIEVLDYYYLYTTK